jgi:hypothetical protein
MGRLRRLRALLQALLRALQRAHMGHGPWAMGHDRSPFRVRGQGSYLLSRCDRRGARRGASCRHAQRSTLRAEIVC